MGIGKYVDLIFLVGGLLLWSTATKLFQLIWENVEVLRDYAILGQDFTLTNLLGFAAAASVSIYLWRHPKANGFLSEVVAELRKVNWPTFPETKLSTWVVIVTTIICSVIMGCFDFFWSWVTNLIYA